ncbi:hypothetical protein D046_1720A, partial [Vibrio parahaemolyticus V-223/04]
MHVTS